jgi:two-component system, OmpR family, sensor histidine kinase KdpD
VHCDASQIERVLVNLIENAAKFSPAGAPVSLRARASEDDHVEISVIDHGPGISLDQRERVFEPFYRGRGGGAGGTGLGLAIARGFVEANAGTLTIEDAPGGGTCMRIVLPSLKVSEEVPA